MPYSPEMVRSRWSPTSGTAPSAPFGLHHGLRPVCHYNPKASCFPTMTHLYPPYPPLLLVSLDSTLILMLRCGSTYAIDKRNVQISCTSLRTPIPPITSNSKEPPTPDRGHSNVKMLLYVIKKGLDQMPWCAIRPGANPPPAISG